jgi:hypothetical protein
MDKAMTDISGCFSVATDMQELHTSSHKPPVFIRGWKALSHAFRVALWIGCGDRLGSRIWKKRLVVLEVALEKESGWKLQDLNYVDVS